MQAQNQSSSSLEGYELSVENKIERYPYMIALAYKKIREAESYRDKLIAVFETYENTVVYVALIFLSIFYQTKKTHPTLEMAAERLECPTLGDWCDFLELATKHLPKETSLVNSLCEWYKRLEKNEIFLQEVHEYKKYDKKISSLRYLQETIQKVGGVVAVLQTDDFQRYFRFCYAILNKILDEAHFLEEYSLCSQERNTDRVASKLHGTKVPFETISFSQDEGRIKNQVFLYKAGSDEFQALSPFLLYQECYYCIREELPHPWELLLFYGRTGSRLAYRGGIHPIALREPLALYLKIKEQHQAALENPPSYSIKEAWERAFHYTSDVLNYGKSIKVYKRYFERKPAEFLVDLFLRSGHSLLVLSGESGLGKSVLLMELAKRWISSGEFVFFFPVFGKRGLFLEEEIFTVLGLQNRNTSFQSLLQESPTPWIIILDGIENSSQPSAFFTSLHRFLRKYSKHTRIILSVRDTFLPLCHQFFDASREDGTKLTDFTMPADPDVALFQVQPWAQKLIPYTRYEAEKLYAFLSQGMAYVPPFLSFSASLQSMLCNPGVMSLFLSCLKNRESPKNLTLLDLIESFVIKEINFLKPRREFLEKVVDLMYQNKISTLSLDRGMEEQDYQIIQGALVGSSFSPMTQAMEAGLLGRISISTPEGVETFLYFPLALLREYLLYRSQAVLGKHQDDMLLEEFPKNNPGSDVVYALAYFTLLRLTNKKHFDRILAIVKQSEKHTFALRKILSEILLSKADEFAKEEGWQKFIEGLLQEKQIHIEEALTDFALARYQALRHEQSAPLLAKILALDPQFGGYSSLFLHAVCTESYRRNEDPKNAEVYWKKTLAILKGVEKELSPSLYLFLGMIANSMKDLEKAESYLQKCLEPKNTPGTLLQALALQARAHVAKDRKKINEALSDGMQAKDLLEKLGRKDKRAKMLSEIAYIYQQQGNFEKALSSLEESLACCAKMGQSSLLPVILLQKGSLLSKMGKLEEAKLALQKVLTLMENKELPRLRLHAYCELGHVHELLQQEKQSRECLEKSAQVLEGEGDKKGLAECQVKFGILEYKKGNIPGALEYFWKAYHLFRELKNSIELGNICNQLGKAYEAQGQKKQALRSFEEGHKIRTTQNDVRGVAEAENNIAALHARFQEFDEALQHVQKAQEGYQKLNDKRGLAMVKGTQGLIYKLQGNGSKALEHYEECAKILEGIQEKQGLGAVYNNLGLLYKDRSDLYQALVFFEKAVKIHEESKDLPGLAASYNNLGLIYDMKNDYDKALEYYTKDLEITEKSGDKRGLATSYNNIAILHYNHKNYARSLWYLEKAMALFQELGEKEMSDRIQAKIGILKEKL